MKYRKLRIAWSLGCGILCLLLIGLWALSYWWMGGVAYLTKNYRERGVSSDLGMLGLYEVRLDSESSSGVYYARQEEAPVQMLRRSPFGGFECAWTDDQHLIRIPAWLVIVGVLMACYAPWLRWRFSLRTLLIGMTVVAVILGLVIWAARS
jgi:hypothetical protein